MRVVRLAVDLPSEGLVAGAIGVVVDEFTEPTQTFEVNFPMMRVSALPNQR
ncbi:DUF4926 domain-containing protein [Lysobacter capsici]|uniref:DUF4926 domain-containing protein n=1 Tax=Lysobacter capsici TaxID=435897 RepID=UPI000BBAFBC8|nr:hypothetical protein CNO08_06615 [Lysobacter capsici]